MNSGDATPADCPFCRVNNQIEGQLLAETSNAFLINNKYNPGNYLIIPNKHYESLLDLPDMWWQEVKILLAKVPDLPSDYNISLNIGKLAGQSINHLHFWVIPRVDGTPASGKGFVKLIDQINAS